MVTENHHLMSRRPYTVKKLQVIPIHLISSRTIRLYTAKSLKVS
jgi:hypothetical protein